MRIDDVVLDLKALQVFSRVENEALRVLVFSATRRQLRTGEVLFRRGDYSDGGYLLLEGEIVLDRSDDGSPSPHIFRPGALIGQYALFSAVERPATALARTNAAVLVMPRDLILKVVDAYPSSAVAMRDSLAEETRKLAATLVRLSR